MAACQSRRSRRVVCDVGALNAHLRRAPSNRSTRDTRSRLWRPLTENSLATWNRVGAMTPSPTLQNIQIGHNRSDDINTPTVKTGLFGPHRSTQNEFPWNSPDPRFCASVTICLCAHTGIMTRDLDWSTPIKIFTGVPL